MKRNEYKPVLETLLSTKNEPYFGINRHKKYPDMYEVYKAFSEKYDIPMNNFILTNGGENALRWALLGLDIKNIKLERPSWGLAEVICEAFNIKHEFYNYRFKDNKFYPEIPMYAEAVYTTDTYNNLFKHLNLPPNVAKKIIIDETYTLSTLLNSKRELKENTIIIGSFSKILGPGLRLGYCLFHESLSDRMNMLREEYIGTDAAEEIVYRPRVKFTWPAVKSDALNIVSIHPVYFTIKADDVPSPYKKFIVDNNSFCRIGTSKNIEGQVAGLEQLFQSIKK